MMDIVSKIEDIEQTIGKILKRLDALEDRREKEKSHYFEDSPFYDFEVFKKRWLVGDEYYLGADVNFYYRQVLNWSKGDAKGKKPKRTNWLSVAKQFALKDKSKGTLQTTVERVPREVFK